METISYGFLPLALENSHKITVNREIFIKLGNVVSSQISANQTNAKLNWLL